MEDVAVSGKHLHASRKRRKRVLEDELETGVASWVPWKHVDPAELQAVLVGSEEGGFISLEEVEGALYDEAEEEETKLRRRKSGLIKEKKRRDMIGVEQQVETVERKDSAVYQSEAVLSLATHSTQDGVNEIGGKSNKDLKRRRKMKKRIGYRHESEQQTDKIDEGSDVGVFSEDDGEDQREMKSLDMSAWEDLGLHSKLERALANLQFTQPTPIQKACIPAAAHKEKDVIGAAETGSGKTLAYVIPILQQLLKEEDKLLMLQSCNKLGIEGNPGSLLRALIITPTRELSLQVCDHFRAAALYTSIKVVPIVGGIAIQKQQRLLKQRPHAVVGTPGRLWELMSAGENHLTELQSLSFFVLDEADRMVDKGHFKELQSIIGMLPGNQNDSSVEDNLSDAEVCGSKNGISFKQRQTFVFSATLALPPGFRKKLKRSFRESNSVASNDDDSVLMLSKRAGVRYNAAIVNLTTQNIVANKLEESVINCREEQKDSFLYYIVKVHGCGRMIIFCTSIAAVRRVSSMLNILQVSACPLHAEMQQRQRLKAMDQFRGNAKCVLVATDVAARGLDISGVRTVIHYQLPHSADVYVHRSGRTARASSDGCSILFVSPSDRMKYSALCRALSKEDGLPTFPIKTIYMPAIEKRIYLAHQIDQILRKNVQIRAKESWLKINAKALGVDIDSDGDSGENNSARVKHLQKSQILQLKKLQQELEELLEEPLEPRSLSHRFLAGVGLSPFVAQQLQDYVAAKQAKVLTGNCSSVKARMLNKIGKAKNKFVVIGQETMEPLVALRTSALL